MPSKQGSCRRRESARHCKAVREITSPKPQKRMVAHDHASDELRPCHAAVNPECWHGDDNVSPWALEIEAEFFSTVGNENIVRLQCALFATTRDAGVASQIHADRV